MKYTIIIELDENRETCLGCPFCGFDDYCKLQTDGEYEPDTSWDKQLSACPLCPLEEYKKE